MDSKSDFSTLKISAEYIYTRAVNESQVAPEILWVLHNPLFPFQSYCEPQAYRPMHHEDFKEDLRKCRTKSRTWAGEKSKREHYSRLKKL